MDAQCYFELLANQSSPSCSSRNSSQCYWQTHQVRCRKTFPGFLPLGTTEEWRFQQMQDSRIASDLGPSRPHFSPFAFRPTLQTCIGRVFHSGLPSGPLQASPRFAALTSTFTFRSLLWSGTLLVHAGKGSLCYHGYRWAHALADRNNQRFLTLHGSPQPHLSLRPIGRQTRPVSDLLQKVLSLSGSIECILLHVCAHQRRR